MSVPIPAPPAAPGLRHALPAAHCDPSGLIRPMLGAFPLEQREERSHFLAEVSRYYHFYRKTQRYILWNNTWRGKLHLLKVARCNHCLCYKYTSGKN